MARVGVKVVERQDELVSSMEEENSMRHGVCVGSKAGVWWGSPDVYATSTSHKVATYHAQPLRHDHVLYTTI